MRQGRKYRYNVTLSHVCELLLPWTNNKYYTFVCGRAGVLPCVRVLGRAGVCMRVRKCGLDYSA